MRDKLAKPFLNSGFERAKYLYIYHRRRQGGGEHRERSRPEIEKNCCRKMMLFPMALVLATTFPKIDKNAIFLMNFHQKISEFSQNFPTTCIFRPNQRKINAGFLKLC